MRGPGAAAPPTTGSERKRPPAQSFYNATTLSLPLDAWVRPDLVCPRFQKTLPKMSATPAEKKRRTPVYSGVCQ